MTSLFFAIAATVGISLISLVGLFSLSVAEARLRRVLFVFVALAAGALLGDAFLHLIPEAVESLDAHAVSLAVLAGIMSFFLLEKALRWHHSHGEEEFSQDHGHIHPLGRLVLTSDAVHNFVDGLAIGAAFIVSPALGIATTLAIALHEIPQEVGDFALLLHAGYSRAKALFINLVSGLISVLGTLVAFWMYGSMEHALPLIGGFSAGMFIYIAAADLVPELHATTGIQRSVIQILAILVGLGAMFLLGQH